MNKIGIEETEDDEELLCDNCGQYVDVESNHDHVMVNEYLFCSMKCFKEYRERFPGADLIPD